MADDLPFRMTDRQLLVHRSLLERSDAVGILYECALRILSDESNPGRLFLSAHSIREMMGDLPKVLALPVLAEQGRLGDQMNALEPLWDGASKSRCHTNGEWTGEIDGPLQKLLKTLHKFFQWWKENRPKRREVAAGLFRQSDPSGLPIPEVLERKRADAWLTLHGYFVGVAHRSSTTSDEFNKRLDDLEQILLDTLYRQPSADLSAIDAILAEETPDA
jgi:hypothetical protein